MAREFICNLGTGRDFSTPATWEAAAATDLTAGDILAFIVTGTPDSYAAGQTVIGDTSGATGTVHCAIGEDGYLCLTGVSGTFTAGGENLTLSGGSAKLTTTDGGDTPVMVLECYNDTTYGAVDISTSWTTSATNRGIIRAASGSGTAGVNYHGGDPTVGVLFSYGGSASTIKVASDRHFSLERVRFTGTGSYPAVLFDTQSTSDPTEGVLAN